MSNQESYFQAVFWKILIIPALKLFLTGLICFGIMAYILNLLKIEWEPLYTKYEEKCKYMFPYKYQSEVGPVLAALVGWLFITSICVIAYYMSPHRR